MTSSEVFLCQSHAHHRSNVQGVNSLWSGGEVFFLTTFLEVRCHTSSLSYISISISINIHIHIHRHRHRHRHVKRDRERERSYYYTYTHTHISFIYIIDHHSTTLLIYINIINTYNLYIDHSSIKSPPTRSAQGLVGTGRERHGHEAPMRKWVVPQQQPIIEPTIARGPTTSPWF